MARRFVVSRLFVLFVLFVVAGLWAPAASGQTVEKDPALAPPKEIAPAETLAVLFDSTASDSLAGLDSAAVLSHTAALTERDSLPPMGAEMYEARVEALAAQNRWQEAGEVLETAASAYPTNEQFRATLVFFSWLQRLKVAALYLGAFMGVAILVLSLLVIRAFKRDRLLAARIYVFGVYVLAIPVAVLGLLFAFPLINAEQTGIGFDDGIAQLSLVIVTCFLGAIGGTITSSFDLNRLEESGRSLTRARFAALIFQPMNGFFLAAVMFIALMSGQLALFGADNMTTPSPWAVALMAVLTGLFSEAALAQLQKLGGSLFGDASDEEAHPHAPPAAPDAYVPPDRPPAGALGPPAGAVSTGRTGNGRYLVAEAPSTHPAPYAPSQPVEPKPHDA